MLVQKKRVAGKCELPKFNQAPSLWPDWEVVEEEAANWPCCEIKEKVDRLEWRAEMDSGVTGSDVAPSQDQAGNVVIETQVQESGASPVAAGVSQNFDGGEHTNDYASLCDRWLEFKQLEWKTTDQPRDFRLGVYDLPFDFVTSFKDQPNTTGFQLYRYWRGDIEVKIIVNSNRFQVGQLQVSWYYCNREDEKVSELRNNVWQASQRDHILLSAGSSNDGVLYIPYRHYLSQINTKVPNSEFVKYNCRIGQLDVRVLNPLTVAQGQATAASITILIKFPNSTFSGMVNRNLDISSLYPHMMSVKDLIGTAKTFLNVISPDDNRDNPIDPAPALNVRPSGSHSLCAMTGISEPINSLRMDLRGQTPHPSGTSTDEMSITYVSSIFGLMKTLVWSSSATQGARLDNFDAAPVADVSQYGKLQVKDLTCYFMPPVAVLSCCFAYWRGELEIRLDVVASEFHVGKLMIAYIPGTVDDVSFSIAKSSPNTVFDLASNRQFVFRVPYISNRPWWPRKRSSSFDYSFNTAPGSVQIFVMSSLIKMTAIPDKVEINVYIRAGPSFEVSIPCTPSIGLSFDTTFYKIPNLDYVTALPGYTPFYTSWYSQFDKTRLTLFYGTTSGKVVQFTKLNPKSVYGVPSAIIYKKADGSDLSIPFRLQFYITKQGGRQDLEDVAAVCRVKDYPYECVYCFASLDDAKAYAATGDVRKVIPYSLGGPWAQIKNGNSWLQWDGDGVCQFDQIKSESLSDYAYESEMDQKRDMSYEPATLVPGPLSTLSGLWTFGECVRDLKDVCRRYNRYLDLRFDLLPNKCCAHAYSIAFPIMPQRLKLNIDPKIDTVDSRLRDGLIPVIASAYRFYRGGLRFKLLFRGLKREDYIVVQFRPDHPAFNNDVVVKSDPDFHNYADAIDYNYSCVYQGLVVNNCIEFEAPWYLTGLVGLLQPIRFDAIEHSILKEFSSLGHIYVFVRTNNQAISRDVGVEVLYSLADDCRFSTFVGFPPVFFINQVSPDKSLRLDAEWRGEMNDVSISADEYKQLLACRKENDTLNKELKDYQALVKKGEVDLDKMSRSRDKLDKMEICHTLSDLVGRTPVNPFNTPKVPVQTPAAMLREKWATFKENNNKPLKEGLFKGFTDTKALPGKANDTLDAVNNAIVEVKDDVKKTTNSINDILDMIKKFFMNDGGIKQKMGVLWDFTLDWLEVLGSLIGQIVHMVLATSWATVMWALSCIFTTLFGFTNLIIAPVKFFWEKLVKLWSKKDNKEEKSKDDKTKSESPNQQTKGDEVKKDDEPLTSEMGPYLLDEDDLSATSMASVIFTAVVSLLNVAVSPPRSFKQLASGLFTNLRHVTMTANSLTTFMRDNITMFKRCFDYCATFMNPENDLLASLTGQTEEIKKWAANVISLTSPGVRNAVKLNRELIAKAYTLQATATILRAQIVANTHKIAGTIQLTRLCDKIDRLVDELMESKVNSPVRYEPFVLYIAGDQDIGKSFLSESIGIYMLKETGFTTYSEPIYVLPSGGKHWNGVDHQPIIKTDDYFAVEDAAHSVQQMADYFAIKTTSKLCPPMAALEEKKLLYNPRIYIVCSNFTHPQNNSVMCPRALWRRRELLLYCRRNVKYAHLPIRQIPNDVLAVYGHLEFFWAEDPSSETTTYLPGSVKFGDIARGKHSGYTYEEFQEHVLKLYRSYTTLETSNYKSRLANLTALYPAASRNSLVQKVEDYTAFILKYQNESRSEPSDEDKQAMDSIVKYLNRMRGEMADTDHSDFLVDILNYGNVLKVTSTNEKDEYDTHCVVKPEDDKTARLITKSMDKYLEATKLNICPHFAFKKYYNYKFKSDTAQMYKIRYDPDYRTFMIPDYTNSVKYGILPDKACVYEDGSVCKECPYRDQENFLLYADYLIDKCPFLFQIITPENMHRQLPKSFIDVYGKLMKVCMKETGSINQAYESAQAALQAQTSELKAVEVKVDGKKRCFLLRCKDKMQSWFLSLWSKLKACNKFVKIVVGVLVGVGSLCAVGYGGVKLKGLIENKFNEGESYTPGLDTTINQFIGDAKYKFYDVKGKLADRRNHFFGKKAMVGEMVASGDAHQLKLQKTHRAMVRELVGQSGPGSGIALFNKIRRNTFFLKALNGNESLTGRCLGIYNHTAIILTHYFERFAAANCTRVLMCFGDCSLELDLSTLSRQRFKNTGYEIVTLPRTTRCFSKLIDYFPSDNGRFDFDPNCDLIEVTYNNYANIRPVFVKSHKSVTVPAHAGVAAWDIVDGFEYGYGGAGTCGSLLISYTSDMPQIIGIHTAGSGGTRGMSESLVRQTFLSKGVMLEPLEPNMGDGDYDEARMQVQSCVIPIARLSSQEIVRLGDKTRILPSEIHGVFPIQKEPVCLSSKDPRYPKDQLSPLLAGCNKHGQIPELFPEEDVKAAAEDLSNKLKANCLPVRNLDNELTTAQAIEGLRIPGYEKMEMQTSEGYPWLKHRPKGEKGKSWMFEWNEDGTKLEKLDVALGQALVQKENELEQGIIPPFVYVACPKDARVALEKVTKEGGARIFDVSPVDATILTRKYFLDFCAAYSRNRMSCENTLGINVNGPEWCQLYDALVSHSEYILDGDYSNYGPGLPHQLLKEAFDIIREWYNYYGAAEEADVARQALRESISNSFSVAHDFVYQRLAGLPSGCCITTQLNSLVNSLFMRVVFLGLSRELAPAQSSLELFKKHVVLFHNGDDIIMSVSGDIISWFNNENISKYLLRYKVKFTSADKTADIVPFNNIREVQYLKCKFLQHPKSQFKQMASLDWASVSDTANWIWKCPNVREASLQNSDQSVRLAYGHGPEKFNLLRKTIIAAWLEKKVHLSLPTWEQLDYQIWYGVKPVRVVLEEEVEDGDLEKKPK